MRTTPDKSSEFDRRSDSPAQSSTPTEEALMSTKYGNARQHYARACRVLPGGVNSSVRFNRALGMPLYATSARGSRVIDVENRELIDMCCAHGAGLLGHAHPAIDAALRRAMELGYVSVFETPYHEELAREICQIIPCAERVRFCSSGTEATLHLIRACRAFTGRPKILRIEGHFHGYHELTYIGGHPPRDYWPRNRSAPYLESAGIPPEFAKLIIPIPHNDPEALLQAIEQHGREIALAILEPINWNWGGIETDPAYLRLLREVTLEAGIVLFFDEIQSVLKTRQLSAQAEFGVIPDVCSIGKSIGGGLPLSGFCGKAEIMDLYRPVGDVAHSGTFNAHLIPILAGLAVMREVRQAKFYDRLEQLGQHFYRGFEAIIESLDLNMYVPHHGARFNIVLGRRSAAQRYEDCFCHEPRVMNRLIQGCFERGVYFHDYGGGPAHHGFSIQHSPEDLDFVLKVLRDTLFQMKQENLV